MFFKYKDIAATPKIIYNKESDIERHPDFTGYDAGMEAYQFLMDNPDYLYKDNSGIEQKYISDIYKDTAEKYGDIGRNSKTYSFTDIDTFDADEANK